MPTAATVKAYQQFNAQDNNTKCKPDSEALWFYMMNHGMALISAARHPLEPLPHNELKFVKTYHEVMGEKARRAFYYLLSICTSEAGYNHSLGKDYPAICDQFGKTVGDIHKGGGKYEILNRLLGKPPAEPIGKYLGSLSWVYYHSEFNFSYGGPKWGNIADVAYRFCTGEFTAEMMLDTVWTLSHNTSAIFDKKTPFYAHNSQLLLRILDIQRSGQIPQAILYDKAIENHVTPDMKLMALELKNRFPEQIGDYVDWHLVEALGGVGSYYADKKAQIAMTPAAKAAMLAKAKAELAKAKADAAEQAAEELKQKNFYKENFQVMPTTWVKKIQIQRAA